jgi:hypothetical protein
MVLRKVRLSKGGRGVEPLVAVGLFGQVGQRASATFSPLLGLVGVIGPTRAVDVAAVAAAGALAGQPLVAFGPPDDRPGAGGWLAGFRCTVRRLRWRPRWRTPRRGGPTCRRSSKITGTARPLTALGPGLRAINTGSRLGMAVWPLRWRAPAMARWRTASGFRVGMPRPWRVKALRSDGQVIPSSAAAAALTLPSRSASRKARSASARSVRKRLGCQPRGTSAGDQLALGTAGGAAVAWDIFPDRLFYRECTKF